MKKKTLRQMDNIYQRSDVYQSERLGRRTGELTVFNLINSRHSNIARKLDGDTAVVDIGRFWQLLPVSMV